jgi:hypothetical protein
MLEVLANRLGARRARALATGALAAMALLAPAGCGTSGGASGASTRSVPSYVTEPPTHEQQLVERGAPLIVADGCAACHLLASGRRIAPSFTSLAGHRVTLADGRRVLVDERFLREALRRPAALAITAYDAAPMIAAVKRAHLANDPRAVEALAAFIEQVGPED